MLTLAACLLIVGFVVGQGRSGDANVIAGPASSQTNESDSGAVTSSETNVDGTDRSKTATNSPAGPKPTDGITDEELSEFVHRLFLDSSEDDKLSLIQTGSDSEAAAVLDTLARLDEKYGTLVNRTFVVNDLKVVSTSQVLVDAALAGESNSGVRSLDVYLDVQKSDDGLLMLAESFCSAADQLGVWCYPDKQVEAQPKTGVDQDTAEAETEYAGVCPIASLNSPSLTSSRPDLFVPGTGEQQIRRYETAIQGQEITMLSSVSIQLLDSPALVVGSTMIIQGRQATEFSIAGDDLDTSIIGWLESEECGYYALNTLGLTMGETRSLAQTIELD